MAHLSSTSAPRFLRPGRCLFTHQRRLRDVDLARYAAVVGVPPQSVVGDAAQPYGDKVEADFRSGVDSGVRGTPTLFLAGRPYAGPVELAALRSAVRRAGSRPAVGD